MKKLIAGAVLFAQIGLGFAQTYPSPKVEKILIQGAGSTGDVSGTSAKPSGAVYATTLDNITKINGINALNYLKGDCSTGDSAALSSLINLANSQSTNGERVKIIFPEPPGGCYALDTKVTAKSNVELIPAGKVLLKMTGSVGGLFFNATGVTNFKLGGFILDQQNSIHTTSDILNFTNSTNVEVDGLQVINATGAIVFVDSNNNVIQNISITGSLSHGVHLLRSYENKVLNSNFQSNAGFGIILDNFSYKNLIQGNKTTSNGIELVGVVRTAYENRIIGNHAEGTGDNCISITGYSNLISSNVTKGCAGAGIFLYGRDNTVTGNIVLNNNTGFGVNAAWSGGIRIQGAFGGVGSNNVVSGNNILDNQASPVQRYSVHLADQAYTTWAAGQSITSGTYRVYNYATYKATNSGTTGGTPPTCTSGTCSDGAVTWEYGQTFPASSQTTQGNIVNNNRYGNSVNPTIDIKDDSGVSTNEILGGFQPIKLGDSTVFPTSVNLSSITNSGSVSSISIVTSPSYSWSGSSIHTGTPAVTIAAPPTGSQATAVIPTVFLIGFGTLATGGAGCSVNDVLTISGGIPVTSATDPTPTTNYRTIRVTAVGASGEVTSFTAGTTGSYYYSVPFVDSSGVYTTTGGTCTTQPTISGTLWRAGAVTVTSWGSGYSSVPTVTYLPANSQATTNTSVTLASSFTLSAGGSGILLDSSGSSIGTSGPGGTPAIVRGGMALACTNQTLGVSYSLPTNASCLRITNSSTLASTTITLPTPTVDGYVVQMSTRAGAITALTFSSAVNGWTNGSTLAAYTGLRIRYDATTSAWYREQ